MKMIIKFITIIICSIFLGGFFLLYNQNEVKEVKSDIIQKEIIVIKEEKEHKSPIYNPLPAEKNYIYVNLNKMEISIYAEKELLKTFPVLSTRNIGSKFDTPKGLYKVISKEELHWSTIGNVWMPWSIHFYGNYFLHGWPYYPDNSPVPVGYSGGCIRLNTKDAYDIYQFSKNDMVILIE